ncbi:Ileal sodium/bile acid cotransporter [Orchesella cincta]|uniref:Ileal sodium/bile acid cotransporter n=1 Tax=Orchesella cincta TaxID=48709 RepID=A0A1D2MWW6_ORCCI|nr:Ileal sodium/bile acid cotransporter [Orchesella cincta]
MCPLWPAHYILMYIMMLGPLWLMSFQMVGAASQAMSKYDVTFEPDTVKQLLIGSVSTVDVKFKRTELSQEGDKDIVNVVYYARDKNIASISPELVSTSDIVEIQNGTFSSKVNITGNFIGYTEICAQGVDANNMTVQETCMDVSVIRVARPIDKAFTYSVAALVAIIYINMGAALDTTTIKATLKRPIGPIIGFFSQFVIMPLLSFGIAKALIPLPALQLGLFITGCSPGGGASNIWTLTLGGNLDLSITMTTISTFSAFVMMPLWILTLGSTIFSQANLKIPYSKIGTFAIALVVPLAVGIIIQRTLPKVAKFLVRILKPFAVFLIIFIVVFAIYTNVYLFKLFTWQILVSGMLLPWLGYILGGGTAFLLRQNWRDVLAIGIETGVQNTGLAIFALRFSLPQPDSDLTTVMPVAVAIMTPALPLLLMLFQKLFCKSAFQLKEERKEPLFSVIEDSSIHSHNGSFVGVGGYQPAPLYAS